MASSRRARTRNAVSYAERCRRTMTIRLCAVGVCAAMLIAVGETAAQTPAQRYGIITFDWDDTVASRTTELGAGLIRVPCQWGQMEPSRGNYTWGCSDA